MELREHRRVIGLAPREVTLVVLAIVIYFTAAVNIGWDLSPPASWLPPLLGASSSS